MALCENGIWNESEMNKLRIDMLIDQRIREGADSGPGPNTSSMGGCNDSLNTLLRQKEELERIRY